jgi:hypothetical protein
MTDQSARGRGQASTTKPDGYCGATGRAATTAAAAGGSDMALAKSHR